MERYSSEALRKIWSETNRFDCMLKAELAHLKSNIKAKNVPEVDLSKISEFKFSEEDINSVKEIESVTKHETLAFLTFLENKFPNETKFMHYGITSSDALDTGLNLQLRDATFYILNNLEVLHRTLLDLTKKYAATPMYGRSHGMHAEITTFGFILSGHAAEFQRCIVRISQSRNSVNVGKFSGPVGNYNHTFFTTEERACTLLSFDQARNATQVIPRDRYAELVMSFALAASAIERLATTIRHLQRPEINEVCEGFTAGQKGSSSMPHKKNPILCENLCGLARIVRATVQPALENINLWHERDMSHSSVERFILPEATTTLSFMIERMNNIMQNIVVYPENMLKKIQDNDSYASQAVLLRLIENGMSRQDAYKIVQECSFSSARDKTSFREQVVKIESLSNDDVERCFDVSKIAEKISDMVHIGW